ncbi:MAG: F0F1 ATP synthase subunit A [Ardenticatenaceae bacterium]|nr:F0F1 ATP synthase subunit A [Ardenticatenaceae bacterium]
MTFIIIVTIAFSLKAGSRTADDVPTGAYNFFEMLIEFAYGYVEDAAGKWAKVFFPFFMTFILWIVIANWMELVPLVDSFGKWENLPHFEAEMAAIEAEEMHLSEEEIHHIEEEVEHAVDEENVGDLRQGILLVKAQPNEEGEKPDDADWTIVPYVRAAATDLNFTIAIAIISVVMTQYYGMKAQGAKYWLKFFPFYSGKGDEIAKNPLAIMDIGVGLLEFISEIFKIVSFAFRLLGNIFAGQVLLFVIGSLLPVGNLLFWHLEFAVGLLQGAVFALLTLTFMKSATESHHGDEHH